MRDRARGYLRRASDQLVRSQEPDGSWNIHWSGGPYHDEDTRPKHEQIRITGHLLEWLAITPTDLRIPQDRLEKALMYVCREVARTDSSEINRWPCDFLHGIRAVCLLSGIRPTESTFYKRDHNEHSAQ
jgi:hypothetical protein